MTAAELFQSTPPSRVATQNTMKIRPPITFQSTPPSRVATFMGSGSTALAAISIHTTLAGGDGVNARKGNQRFFDFNPHHPRGWRQHRRTQPPATSRFQSTPPSRVATTARQTLTRHFAFQSTPPSRVATRRRSLGNVYGQHISIHTTLAGGDKWVFWCHLSY